MTNRSAEQQRSDRAIVEELMMLIRCVAIVALSIAATSLSAATLNEAVNGDLSGDRAAPTQFNLATGSNTLTATTQGGDLDVVKINVPAGNSLSQLLVQSFNSSFGDTLFIAIQPGITFTVDPNIAGVDQVLGFTHFSQFDTDILPAMGRGFGAIGFTPPLSAGPYSLFLQHAATPISYQLDFVVSPVPEPTSIVLGGIGLAFFCAAARRRSH